MILVTDRRGRFEAIAAEVFEPLQRYLRRRVPTEDAADILAEVLLTMWRRVEDVPEDRPLPWCYGVARRTLANHRRSQYRHLRLVQRLEREAPIPAPDPADSVGDPEVAQALARLSASDQEILRLWAWEQLEPREIAEVLGSTPNAVSLRLSRAKRKLAASLRRQSPASAGQEEDRETEVHDD